jgi:chitinase
MPTKPALYADHFVGRPTLNGRVGCDEHGNGGQAVNFECFESCCMPHVVGLPDADRKEQCEAVGGVTAGTQGFVACEGGKGDVHIANLEIVTCPARADLSSGNVKMPSCPSVKMSPQNPQIWTQSTGQMKNGLASSTSASPSSADPIGSTSTTTSVSSTTDADADTDENSSVDENGSTLTTTSVSSTTDADGLTDDNDSVDQNDATSTTTASSTDSSTTDGLMNTTTASAEEYGSSSNRDSNGYTLHI